MTQKDDIVSAAMRFFPPLPPAGFPRFCPSRSVISRRGNLPRRFPGERCGLKPRRLHYHLLFGLPPFSMSDPFSLGVARQ
jgi:hypothetical protein